MSFSRYRFFQKTLLSFILVFSLSSCLLSPRWRKIEDLRTKAESEIKQNEFDSAISTYNSIIKDLVRTKNKRDFDLHYEATIQHAIGSAYLAESNYTDIGKAIASLKKAERIFQSLGEDGYLAPTLVSLGLAYQQESNLTDYSKSLSYYDEAEVIYSKTADLKNVTVSKRHQGSVLYKMKKFNEAINAFRSSLSGNEIDSLQEFSFLELEYFAGCYLGLGHYYLAHEILHSAITDSKSRSSKLRNSRIFNSLGIIELKLGYNKKASSYFQQALVLQREIFGEDKVELSLLYHNLGMAEENSSLAISYFEKSKKILTQKFPETHPSFSPIYSGLMSEYHDLRDYNRSRAYAEKIIQNESGKTYNPTSLANAYTVVGDIYGEENNREKEIQNLIKSFNVRTKFLGESHPDTLVTLEDLIISHWAWDEINESSRLTEHLLQLQEDFIKKVFNYLPQNERLNFISQYQPFSFASNTHDPILIFKTSIRRKGLVFDTIIEDKQNFRNFSLDDESISSLILNNAKKIPRRSLALERSKLAKSIPKHTALIDFVSFNNWDDNDSDWIGAILITNEQKSPRWIKLCKADSVFSDLSKIRNSIGSHDLGLKFLLQKIYRVIIEPLSLKFAKDIKTLIICPDAELNFIPFPALIDKNGSFLCEKYDIMNVSASRDLLFGNEPASKPKEISIFANPAFDDQDIEESLTIALMDTDRNAMRNLGFSPLPGTKKEAEELSLISDSNGYSVNSFSKLNASEKNLRAIKSPTILHLATHGFFISSEEEKKSKNRLAFLNDSQVEAPISNPMHRSGLALAGAKNTLKLWEEGKFVDPSNDGILTAEEASQLDLRDTWLTVLSACDTGSGVARAGEGVLGLRRAFAMAGTQNLLLTLWPVDDSFTKDFMVSFYKEALKTGNAPKAMAKVQKEWLIKLREERSISQAVKLAGPFVLTFRGNPELN